MLDEEKLEKLSDQEQVNLVSSMAIAIIWFFVYVSSLIFIGMKYDSGLAWLLFVVTYSLYVYNNRIMILRLKMIEITNK